ncbi:MAG: sporulation protein YunB [Firmicutes bacterium]|nr:sporulation protein YunB [Bacillota bacterium]
MSIKNTMLYRRFWYVKKRYRGKIHIHFLTVGIIIIFFILAKYTGHVFIPYIDEFSEYRVKSVLNIAIYDVVRENFLLDGLAFEDLVKISKDVDGNITAITMNSVKVNEITAKLSREIQHRINSIGEIRIKVPFGALFGDTIFYNMGPDVNINLRQYGNIETEFTSEFTGAGINQTKHRIVLVVKVNFGVSAAFIKKKCNMVTTVPIAETVIVGKTPYMFFETKNENSP